MGEKMRWDKQTVVLMGIIAVMVVGVAVYLLAPYLTVGENVQGLLVEGVMHLLVLIAASAGALGLGILLTIVLMSKAVQQRILRQYDTVEDSEEQFGKGTVTPAGALLVVAYAIISASVIYSLFHFIGELMHVLAPMIMY